MSDVSTLFELLADVHRRRILLTLCRSESIQVPEDVRPPGEGRTPRRQGTGPDRPAIDEQEARPLALELHHRHLPKLVDAGVVEWDRDAGTVTRGPTFEAFEPALRLVADNDDAFPGDLR